MADLNSIITSIKPLVLVECSGSETAAELVKTSTRPWSHASGPAGGVVTTGLLVRQLMKTWLLLEFLISAQCTDKFDEKYKDSCEGGQWRERAFFDQEAGECATFWWDGCTSTSQNFFSDLKACQSVCEHPGHEPYERMPDPDTKYRCLLPKEIGKCKETYPFYHFDRRSKSCQPFSYSGCDTEMDCYFPLDQGFEKNNKTCVENAGYRFHFHSELVCFRPPGDKGNCPGNANYTVKRWTYTAQLKCAQFTYSGCGGNDNRFATQMDCELTCKGKKPSNNAALCSHDPDSGSCNQLRYMWFYNQTRGTCDQFLYGGCEGNSNRFESFEICQKNCEVSGL
ncbi:Kunitz/Bovine pancreatic trypsin inhibitor domain protein, partial [Ancylostoma duodenale]